MWLIVFSDGDGGFFLVVGGGWWLVFFLFVVEVSRAAKKLKKNINVANFIFKILRT